MNTLLGPNPTGIIGMVGLLIGGIILLYWKSKKREGQYEKKGLRGVVLAFVLYPFYDCIVKGNHGGLILFGALWGLAILGSLEPLPGSIEGLIYTETTLVEHFMVLIAGAVQVMLFSWLFLRWEHSIGEEVDYYE